MWHFACPHVGISIPMPTLPEPASDPTKGYPEFADVQKARESAYVKFNFALKLADAALSTHSGWSAAIQDLKLASTYWSVVVQKAKDADASLQWNDMAYNDKHQIAQDLLLEANKRIEACNQTIGLLGQDQALHSKAAPIVPPSATLPAPTGPEVPPGAIIPTEPIPSPGGPPLVTGETLGWGAAVGGGLFLLYLAFRAATGAH